jgi:hypothetical protein
MSETALELQMKKQFDLPVVGLFDWNAGGIGGRTFLLFVYLLSF